MSEAFKATQQYVGDSCCLCGIGILLDEDIRYYGGPFVVHASCITKIIEHV